MQSMAHMSSRSNSLQPEENDAIYGPHGPLEFEVKVFSTRGEQCSLWRTWDPISPVFYFLFYYGVVVRISFKFQKKRALKLRFMSLLVA